MLHNRYVFIFKHPATTEIYTLSLHDALPICLANFDLHAVHAQPPFLADIVIEARIRRERAVFDFGHERSSRCPDRKSTRLNSSHMSISYAVFCLKKKNNRSFKTYFLIDT